MLYFTIRELTKSTTASNLGINNIPNKKEELNLINLVNNILDPLRKAWGKPIVVNSGFRCEQLNKAVGGAVNSQHKYGLAADIETHTRSLEDNKRLYDLLISLKLPFDLIIWEYGNNTGPDWIHVSYNKDNNRGNLLKASKSKGKTVYSYLK